MNTCVHYREDDKDGGNTIVSYSWQKKNIVFKKKITDEISN